MSEWNRTCKSCPMFEAVKKPEGFPDDAEFRLGMCNGAPDAVCLVPMPAPPQAQQRVITNPNVQQQTMQLVPETFRRIVDCNRRACSIHPDWTLYTASLNADAWQELALREALRQAPTEGNA